MIKLLIITQCHGSERMETGVEEHERGFILTKTQYKRQKEMDCKGSEQGRVEGGVALITHVAIQ